MYRIFLTRVAHIRTVVFPMAVFPVAVFPMAVFPSGGNNQKQLKSPNKLTIRPFLTG
jgi:hypothetical protein